MSTLCYSGAVCRIQCISIVINKLTQQLSVCSFKVPRKICFDEALSATKPSQQATPVGRRTIKQQFLILEIHSLLSKSLTLIVVLCTIV